MQAAIEGIDQTQTTTSGPPSELIKRYQIAVKDLDFGMFVAELDRPWLDTPFILQGFLIESQVELDTIRKQCKYVFVDFELSKPEVSEAILKADMERSTDLEVIVLDKRPTGFGIRAVSDEDAAVAQYQGRQPKDRAFKARSDLKVSASTRQRFNDMLRNGGSFGVSAAAAKETGAFGRFLKWLRGEKDDNQLRRTAIDHRRAALKGLVPADFKLRTYKSRVSFEEEMPRARETFRRSDEIISNFVTDIRNGKSGQIKEVQGAVIDIVDSIIDNPDALIWIARLRDEDVRTYNHSVKVALYLIAFGRHLGFPKQDLAHLGMIGMLADVGKSKLPRALIEKPGMLAPQEFTLIKEHVNLGLKALKQTMTLPLAVEQGIAQHHERMDGSGYPAGLKGDQISVYGRMAAIADCFSALITPRPYANPSAPQEALMNMFQWAGSAFHEPLVEQFVQAVGVFPTGSLVELSTGEVGVVLTVNRVKRLQPTVLVLTNPDKVPLSRPIELNLSRNVLDAKERPIRIVRGLPAGAYGLKLRDYYMTEVAKANGL